MPLKNVVVNNSLLGTYYYFIVYIRMWVIGHKYYAYIINNRK